MDRSAGCRAIIMWRAVVAALILMVLVIATAFVATVHRQDNGEEGLDNTQWTGVRRQRRDTEEFAEITATSAPEVETISDLPSDKSTNYFPVYREVGGRSIDWDSEQMSTDGFDVESRTDFIDGDDEEYDESKSLDTDYDYTNGEELVQETSEFNVADVQTNMSEESVNSSSPRGKEFADYYADFDDGQKFDEDEYETTFIKPGMHYGDNVEIVEQMMVREDSHGVGSGPRRVSRRRRRRRGPRPLRRRRVRIARRRTPRRLLRVPAQTNGRLNRIRLSRDNIQLHPTIRRTQLTSSVPRMVSYSPTAETQYVPKATVDTQYMTVDEYTGSQASPVFVQLQNPLSSSSTLDGRLGLVEDIQLIGLGDAKTTTSVNNQQVGKFGNYATMTGREVVVPVTLQQSQQHFPSQEILVPLQVAGRDEQHAGGGVQLVMPVKTSVDYLSPSAAVQVVNSNADDLTLLPVRPVHDQHTADSRQPRTLRTLPEVGTSSPTYIILKLSGDDGADKSGTERRGSSGEIVDGQSVDLGDKVKYIDLSKLLSTSHQPVSLSRPRKASLRRPPKSPHRPTRPQTVTKPTRRRPPQPPSPAHAPPTPPSPSRQRPRPPPSRPLPPPASSQQPRQFEHGYNSNQHRYPSSRYHHRHHHHHYQQHQQQQHQHQHQRQQDYSQSNEQHLPSHISSRYEAHSGAIMPRFRPTQY